MDIYLRTTKDLPENVPLGQINGYVSRERLMKMLRKRYNMEGKYATSVPLRLPFSKTKVEIMVHQARDCVHQIITDPRWQDDDWLFFDNNPFAPPPASRTVIGDINTGDAYRATYQSLITKPDKQILVPIPLYIDGAVTGQFDKLSIEAMKMTLGILNRKARDKEYAWKTLGYVPNYKNEEAFGQKFLFESGHISAFDVYADLSDPEDVEVAHNNGDRTSNAGDYHGILSVILRSLYDLFAQGMVIDLHYRGKVYKKCELVFFVPFVKCDGDEGDKLCLSYRCRTKNVSQLCRYCQCPTVETDNFHLRYPAKTEPLLKGLYERRDTVRLQELSQVNARNAFHGLQFGTHTNYGIHGATPMEMLHAILLGIFKYARDCLLEQLGEKSKITKKINGIAEVIGKEISRSSDRDKPRTKFGNGIFKGKLMAKEFTGVLLVMSALFRSKAGQDLLLRKKTHFPDIDHIKDWSLLVETLLEWEQWLKLDEMSRSHVQRFKTKRKFIQHLIVRIGKRAEGMGFKVMKFHAMVHLAFDIIAYGVPMVVDTGSNESHHKTTKVAARLTQKEIKSFEKQTCDRLDDFYVLDMAMEELKGRRLFDYFFGHEHDIAPNQDQVDTTSSTGGMKYQVWWDYEAQVPSFNVTTRRNNAYEIKIDFELLEFLFNVTQIVGIDDMKFCSEHRRSGVVFRSHPNYRGKGPWIDWVMINWGKEDHPAMIWGFFDLTMLEDVEYTLHNGDKISNGVYAIVESAHVIEDGNFICSNIWTSIEIEAEQMSDDGETVVERRYYVVDVESFKDPIVVISDTTAVPNCRYLMMKHRSRWANDFINWLKADHKSDHKEMGLIEDSDEEEENEDD